jgi:hypothetical protein
MSHRKTKKLKYEKEYGDEAFKTIILEFGKKNKVELSSKLVFKDAGEKQLLEQDFFPVKGTCSELSHEADEGTILEKRRKRDARKNSRRAKIAKRIAAVSRRN